MNRFEFARPTSVNDAVALLSEKPDEVAPLAGGTDLLSLMKDFVVEPKRLVSLMGIDELRGTAPVVTGMGSAKKFPAFQIGSTTTIDDLLGNEPPPETHPSPARSFSNTATLKTKWPALWQAAAGIRSPQLRAMGTVGGELLQRPRCWYFRRGHGLLAERDGNSLPANGDNRYHAILGNTGPAKFVHPSSLAPALIACDADATIAGPKQNRQVPLKDLFRIPKSGERETTLAPNEILVAITLPNPPSHSATYEVRPRQGLDWPLVTASVALDLDGKTIKSATIVLGHVAPIPWVCDDAAKLLVGKTLDDKLAHAVGAAAVAGATPLSKNAYKVDLAQVAVRRALAAAVPA